MDFREDLEFHFSASAFFVLSSYKFYLTYKSIASLISIKTQKLTDTKLF